MEEDRGEGRGVLCYVLLGGLDCGTMIGVQWQQHITSW